MRLWDHRTRTGIWDGGAPGKVNEDLQMSGSDKDVSADPVAMEQLETMTIQCNGQGKEQYQLDTATIPEPTPQPVKL